MGRTKCNDVYRGRDHSRKTTEHGALHRVHAERRRHCTWFIRQRVLRHMSRHTNRPAGVLRHSKTEALRALRSTEVHGSSSAWAYRQHARASGISAVQWLGWQHVHVRPTVYRFVFINPIRKRCLQCVCISVNTCASEAHRRSVSAD